MSAVFSPSARRDILTRGKHKDGTKCQRGLAGGGTKALHSECIHLLPPDGPRHGGREGGGASRGHEGYLRGAPTSPRRARHAAGSNAGRQRCVTFGHFGPGGLQTLTQYPYPPPRLTISESRTVIPHPPSQFCTPSFPHLSSPPCRLPSHQDHSSNTLRCVLFMFSLLPSYASSDRPSIHAASSQLSRGEGGVASCTPAVPNPPGPQTGTGRWVIWYQAVQKE